MTPSELSADAKADFDPLEFHPALLQLQEAPPSPIPRAVLRVLLAMLAILLLWALIGRIDIVATAQGKLVPEGYVKIVQPAESGIVREILVKEGETVTQGQVLMRLDAVLSQADERSLFTDYHTANLTIRRIDSELAGTPLKREEGDPDTVFQQAETQLSANQHAHADAVELERRVLASAQTQLKAAKEIHDKIEGALDFYVRERQAFEDLAAKGLVGRLALLEKERTLLEQEQDLRTQVHAIRAAREEIAQAQQRLVQLESDRRRSLLSERSEAAAKTERLRQELAKVRHRQDLLELKAPHEGTIKDVATHTIGTVVSPGTVLMTVVPVSGKMRAEVFVSNHDIGFISLGQQVKVKLDTYEFQRYGMLEGTVNYVSADAVEDDAAQAPTAMARQQGLAYRALIELGTDALERDGARFGLAPGMRVNAEILIGRRSVMEYLLSPISKTVREAGRER